MVAAQAAYEKSSEKTDFSKKMDSVWEYLKKLFRLSLDTKLSPRAAMHHPPTSPS